MVDLQSGVYYVGAICVHFKCTQCELCVWLHLMEVCFFLIVLQLEYVVEPGFDSNLTL